MLGDNISLETVFEDESKGGHNTEKGKVLKAGLGYMIGNMFIKGVAFITLPIFTRLLSTDDYGIYNTYGAYEAILAIVMGLGMYSSIKNAQYDYKEKVNTYIATLLSILCIAMGVMLIFGLAFHQAIGEALGFGSLIVVLMIMQAFGTAALNIANSALSLNYNYKTYLLYASINSIGNVLLSVVLILTVFENNRSLGRIIGSAMSIFALGCWILVSYYRKTNTRFDKHMAKYAITFGFPLIWHYLAQTVASQFDRIMITNMIGASETGIYSFVYTIASIFSILFYSTDNVWSVWFYKQMSSERYENIRKKANQYMGGISVLAIGMMVCSKEVMQLMSSRVYWSGFDLFMPIIIGLFFLFIYTIPVAIEYYYKETKYIAATTFVSAITNIVLNYIFIPLFGYSSAAYTTAFSYFVMFIMHWIISKRIMKKHSSSEVFMMKDFLRYIVVILIMASGVYVLNDNPVAKYTIFGTLSCVLVIVFRKSIRTLFESLKSNMH